MNSNVTKYLRLFDDHGEWITRPDYMVLAALSRPDLNSIEHTYRSMLLEDDINPPHEGHPLSDFASDFERSVIRRRIKQRSIAGEVILELARLAASTGKSPSITTARKIVSYNQSKYFRSGTARTTYRRVEQAFSEFRDTAHLQATVGLDPSALVKMSGDKTEIIHFLSIARGFQEFIEAGVLSKSFKWSPLRVPEQIPALYSIKFIPLPNEELAAANLN